MVAHGAAARVVVDFGGHRIADSKLAGLDLADVAVDVGLDLLRIARRQKG